MTIVYRDQPGLGGAQREQVRQLLPNPATVDPLAEVAAEVFAQLSAGCRTLEATAAD